MREKTQEILWKFKKFLLKLFYCPQKFFIINGEFFYGGKPCATKNNMLARNKKYILKVENFKHDKKKNNLERECRFLKYLNGIGNLSQPKIIKVGTCFYKRPYFIMEKLTKKEGVKPFDIFFAILEQQRQGVMHHDIKSDNIIFDGTIAKLIDYDQSYYIRKLKKLSLKENIQFFLDKKGESWFANFGKSELGENKKEVIKNFDFCFVDERFNFSLTSLYEKMTENGECFWELDEEEMFSKGKNNLKNIAHILNQIEFKKDEKILDFGSDIGTLSLHLADKGKVFFYDPNNYKMQATQMISNILHKKITPYNLIQEKDFDSVLFINHEMKLTPEFLDLISKKTTRIIIQEDKNIKRNFKNFNLIKEFELENNKVIKVFEK